MTAPTEDRSGRPAAGRPTRTAREGSASSRVIAFVLLCVASLALAAGYAWWSTARRASFVQDVALPPIGSLAELDSPAAAIRVVRGGRFPATSGDRGRQPDGTAPAPCDIGRRPVRDRRVVIGGATSGSAGGRGLPGA